MLHSPTLHSRAGDCPSYKLACWSKERLELTLPVLKIYGFHLLRVCNVPGIVLTFLHASLFSLHTDRKIQALRAGQLFKVA